MAKRRIHDDELHAQFVTFSCYRRRCLLDHPRARQVVIAMLADELQRREGTCCGFVVMPDHVHAILWFPATGCLSPMMQTWKSRSSRQLKKFLRGQMPQYAQSTDRKDPFWQAKYYPFNLYTERKAKEKLDYMHTNPVRAGLVSAACDWRWSSARYYEQNKPVGVPLGWVF
ncbi:MAG: transposase [Planctomycetes bacterium]|nr:transposase [Planctomycetota bacterium]